MQHNKAIVVSLGEILWDLFPDRQCFGGAPANFACAASELGRQNVNVHLVSGVGADELGAGAIAALRSHQVQVDRVQQKTESTGTVTITLDDRGIAEYEFAENVAWDHLVWNDQLELLAKEADAVCFGTLGQRSLISSQTIQRFVKATRDECIRVFDINLRPPYWTRDVVVQSLELANVVKMNDEELPIVAELNSISGCEAEQIDGILKQFDLDLIALTRGAMGATLVTKDLACNVSGLPCEIVDTVGAGDAFAASLALSLLGGEPLERVIARANQVAAFVCSQPGATPSLPVEVSQLSLDDIPETLSR